MRSKRLASLGVLIVIVLAASSALRAADLSHTTSSLPNASLRLDGAAADGKLFLAGEGSTIHIYDTPSGTWSTDTLTHGYHYITVVSAGDLVFFAGGWSSGDTTHSDVVDIYNVATDTWSMTRLSVARSRMATAVVGDKVLFAGGYMYPGGDRPGSTAVDIYDADTDEWSTASLSQGRWNHAVAVVDDKVLFAGGAIDRGYDPTLCTDVVDVYDSATGQWSVAPPLAVARCQLGSAYDNNFALFAGGDREYGSIAYDMVDIYVPEPATLALLGLGAMGLIRMRRRKVPQVAHAHAQDGGSAG